MRLADARRDQYRRLAKDQGYRARSAYKLLQINRSYHIIKKGDTLYSIAKANGTTLQQICDWNGIKDPDKIFLGQKIRVK